ncbi:MAG: hypothetical protein M3517_11420, partial [Actinomycetota bacterium]|nr:hypothetical protein [Actinomycetota bacterium]
MPFDDDFDAGEPSEPADRGDGRLPAYDSGTILQQRGIGYPSARPAGMTALREYVMDRWGGADLGCLSLPPRPMRGSTSPSLHNWGMAWDWRWANPGPGRASANEVIEFCVEHAGDLGIQGVHDYEQCRYWKSYDGWNTATASASSGFGQSWAQWLHIERTWAAANDGRPLTQALAEAGVTVPAGGGGATSQGGPGDVQLPTPTLELNDKGANVARLQDFLRFFKFADFTRSDGEFGLRTQAGVKKAQQDFAGRGWYSAEIDGEYGPRSAAAAAKYLAAAASAGEAVSACRNRPDRADCDMQNGSDGASGFGGDDDFQGHRRRAPAGDDWFVVADVAGDGLVGQPFQQ